MTPLAKHIAYVTALAALAPWTAQGATLRLQTGAPDTPDGDIRLPVRIEVEPAEPVASLQFDIHFEPGAMIFRDVLTGDAAKDAAKSVHFNLMRPDMVRVIVAGLNRNAFEDGLVASARFSPSDALPASATVTMAAAILSDPYGNSVPVTLAPDTVLLDSSAGTLRTRLATGSSSSTPAGDPYANYRALLVALLGVIAAMVWARHSTRKGRKR